MSEKTGDPDIEDLDIEIEITEEQASRPLTVGEFAEVFGSLQNQITLLALASVRLLENDMPRAIKELDEAYELAAKSAETLKAIVENTWEPRDDG